MSNNSSEINKAIYEQDCESYRYQDGLKWSRFQTAATIEGAVLIAVFQVNLVQLEQRILMAFGFLLILIICLMSMKDETDASSYEDRIKKFEKLGERFVPRKWPRILSGRNLMRCCIVLLNFFNLLMLMMKWN